MRYLYTQTNRLDEPHSYMYTPFEGGALLQAYELGRLEVLHRFSMSDETNPGDDAGYESRAMHLLEQCLQAWGPEEGARFRAMVPLAGKLNDMPEHDLNVRTLSLMQFQPSDSISTLELLQAVIAAQLTERHDGTVKEWLDRLVQRFEVTKKIYGEYLPGFRKGGGADRSVRLYWLFALALSLHYGRHRQLKFLSTLLKVCDLLCSLPESLLVGYLPPRMMKSILAVEVISIQSLRDQKGIQIASA